jgi:hypothetical protein
VSAPLDGELAWAIGCWAADGDDSDLNSRSNIESLTRHLSARGFTNKAPADPIEAFRKLRPTVERIFASADEFLGGPKRDSTKA